mmetsp:Transcript_5948/g.8157  ORF Transcript_5948/g.8157 Transcript_5948/m.8157 type:complete len:81 (+) Transcript_5948:1738-1980(+)
MALPLLTKRHCQFVHRFSVFSHRFEIVDRSGVNRIFAGLLEFGVHIVYIFIKDERKQSSKKGVNWILYLSLICQNLNQEI